MSHIKCPQCNLTNWATAITCKRCGYFFQPVNLEVAENPSPVNNETSFPVPPPTSNPPVSVPQQPWTSTNGMPSNYQRPNYSNYQNPSSQNKKMAIFSLILGILSFPMINLLVGVVLSLVLALILGGVGAIIGIVITLLILPTGLITGVTALVRANKRPNEYGGKGFAIAGIVLSGFGILVLPVVAAIAIPNILAARKSANEGSAISSLRSLAEAEEKFMAGKMAQSCGDLTELGQVGLIDSVLAGGTKSGYVFVVAKLPVGCEIHATPVNAKGTSATGTRSFYYSTEDRTLRAGNKNGQLAGKNDEPLGSDLTSAGQSQRPQIASQ